MNGGETSEIMQGRPEHPRVRTGCKLMSNAVCMAQGGVTRRPGLFFCGLTDRQSEDETVLCVPFVYAATEARVLEISHRRIRVWLDDVLVEVGGVPYETITGYGRDDLRKLRFKQSGNVVYIASPKHKPSKLTRVSDTEWVFEVIEFLPETEVPTGVGVNNTTTVPTTGSRLYSYVVTALDPEIGEESTPSAPANVTASILNSIDGNFNTVTWVANDAAVLEYRVYKLETGVYGYIGRSITTTFTDDNIGADTGDTPPSTNDPFTAPGDYPALVYFWEQRLGWARTLNEPFGFWMSPSANFESLSASIPPVDSDAITATLAAAQADGVQWVEGDRVLLTGTSGNEWSVGKADEPLTPTNIGFNRQSGIGSEDIPPLMTSDALLYVQRGGDIIRECMYEFSGDRYKAQDLTIIASHLFDGKKIVNWCYQLNPYSVVWIVLDDGSFVAMTYMKEHEVVGLHRHSTTGGFIEDCCAVPGAGYDRVYFVIRRTIGGEVVRTLERLDNYFVRQTDKADAFFVDSGVKYDGVATSSLTGIAPHLVGQTVKVWADGAGHPDAVVGEMGTITLDRAATKVHAGLRMVSDLIPNRPEIITPTDTTLTNRYKVNEAIIRFYRSTDVKAGANEDELTDIIFRGAHDPIDPQLITGDRSFPIDTGWDAEWSPIVRADGAGPMTVLALIFDVEGEES